MPKLCPSLATGLVLYGVLCLAKRVYTRLTSPIRHIAGPRRQGIVRGDVGHHMDAWRAQFGPTFSYPGMFGTNLHTSDVLALQHILKNADIYQRPAFSRKILGNGLLGAGLLTIEGQEHRNLRKIMVIFLSYNVLMINAVQNPAFGTPQMRALGEIFMAKSAQLRDNWLDDLSGGSTRIDVLLGLRSMSLDVIALAGFNYDSHSLDRTLPPSELDAAFTAYFQPTATYGARMLRLLQLMFPVVLYVPLRVNVVVQRARASLDRISHQLLQEGKTAIENSAGGEYEKDTGTGHGRKDLLSLLLKANTGDDIPASQRISDKVVLAQIPTFLVAGHETTSVGTAWALYALALNPTVQQKLRAELYSVTTDTPSVEELNELPYLKNVVKEVLRLHPAIGFTVREAQREDVVPLRHPCIDRKGRVLDSVAIAKGQLIHIPILGVQRDKTLWGADADEFRPERWDALPESVKEIPGIYAHLLAFLGGPHSCIGAKFSIFEIKALLFTLVRAMEFEMVVPKEDVGRTTAPVGSPFLLSERDKGAQMSLLLRSLKGL
ncbi:cytochrome P450 [Mycena metata]|uniref:Cytochrome P450 n=1 Tax=Mycena metata TaxID=1033252 RepID=A0AAD7MZC8_9AGAR|nr:cytochrome P450 [Mycena metata]